MAVSIGKPKSRSKARFEFIIVNNFHMRPNKTQEHTVASDRESHLLRCIFASLGSKHPSNGMIRSIARIQIL